MVFEGGPGSEIERMKRSTRSSGGGAGSMIMERGKKDTKRGAGGEETDGSRVESDKSDV